MISQIALKINPKIAKYMLIRPNWFRYKWLICTD